MTSSTLTAANFNGLTTTSLTTNGRITASQLYDTDYLENQYDYNQTQESYDSKDLAQDEAIATKIANVLYLIETGYEDKAMEAYNELITEISGQTQYATLSESELQAVAKTLLSAQVKEDTDGEFTDIQDYIVEYAADSNENYWQTVWNNDSKVDTTTEEDLLKGICGIETDDSRSGFTTVVGGIAKYTVGWIASGWDTLFGAKHH